MQVAGAIDSTETIYAGNEGYCGGNMYLYFLLFTTISVTVESSSLTTGRGSRGGGVLVIIDQDVAVNDNYSCGEHSVLNQKYHQLLYFSNVTLDVEILERDFTLKIESHQAICVLFC